MKKTLEKALNDINSPTFHTVNNFLALLTIFSIFSLILETVPALTSYQIWFFIIEWTAVIIFTIEYLSRLYISKPRSQYTLSFFGIIDLVSIVPSFIGLGNFVFLKSARSLRIIRLLRMFRLAKISRLGSVDEHNMSLSSLNVMIYMSTLIFSLLATGTAMYLVEPNLTSFESIPAGMWWSLKVFLGSISVVQPETSWGELFFVLTRFVGLCLLGLLISVIGNLFRNILLPDKKN